MKMVCHCPNCGDECDPIARVHPFGHILIECVRCDNFFEVWAEPVEE